MPYVDRPGCRLAYQVLDVTPAWVTAPETIVFYHGVSVTAGLWGDWIPVLCSAYRIVTFDTRGYGRSAPHDLDIPWSMELMVADLMAVADAAGLTRFHLVGESAGGTAALAATIAHPDRVASLIVSNGAANGTAIQNVRGVWNETLGEGGRDGWVEQMMQWRFFPDGLPKPKYEWFRRQQATCSAEATTGIAALLLRTDLSDRVAEIAVPTLILSPDASPFIPVGIAAALQAQIPGAKLQVFAHARHGMPLSHGRACAKSVLAFLQRQTSEGVSA
jgi:pimeloyl-ACP methyl ester carboxylesterase